MWPKYVLMEEQSGVSGSASGGSGSGSQDAGAGSSKGQAGAGAGAGGGSGSGAGSGGGAGGAAAWHGLTEADAVAYIGNKGWQSPADVIKSYQGAEKLIGRDPSTLLVVPRADDPAGMRAAFQKLGMPEDPKAYEFDTPKGAALDEAYLNWARGTFHELGLTKTQVKELSAKHNAYVAEFLTKQQADYEAQTALEKKELLGEWRGGHERMLTVAQAAAKALGFEQPVIDAIEKSIGYAKTMKLFAGIGQKMSESGFVSSGERPKLDGMMTPDEAKQQWEVMKVDPVESKALFDATHPGHKTAKEKQSRLFKVMYPE